VCILFTNEFGATSERLNYSLLILDLSVFLVSGPLWHVFIGLNDSCGPCLPDEICVLHSLKTYVFSSVSIRVFLRHLTTMC